MFALTWCRTHPKAGWAVALGGTQLGCGGSCEIELALGSDLDLVSDRAKLGQGVKGRWCSQTHSSETSNQHGQDILAIRRWNQNKEKCSGVQEVS